MTAIVLVGAGQMMASRAATLGARAAEAQTGAEREMWAAAHEAADLSDWVGCGVLIVWGVAMGAWGCSLGRRERGLQSLPMLLFLVVI